MPLASELDTARWYASPHFPADAIFELFRHGEGHREWVVDNPHTEIYKRYLTARSGKDLRKLQKTYGPGKLHCGPRYADDPSDRRIRVKVPIEREFIMDFDLSDYGVDADSVDDCARAWPLIVLAMKSVGLVLESHFGFEHVVYAHSGRRGGHVWVLDAAARELTDEERKAIVSWCTPHGRETQGGKVRFEWACTHPNFRELSALAEKCFVRHCLPSVDAGGLGMLDEPDDRVDFAEAISPRLAAEKEAILRNVGSGSEAYVHLVQHIRKIGHKGAFLMTALRAAVLSRVWMKPDAAVSTTRNHTLKVFFSVHPKTGCVSLPIPKDELDAFDPRTLPTVGALFEEDEAAVMAVQAAARHIGALARVLASAEAEGAWRSTAARHAKRSAEGRPGPSTPRAKTARIDLREPQLGVGAAPQHPVADCARVVLVLKRTLSAYARSEDLGTRVRLVLNQLPADAARPLRLVPARSWVPFPPDEAMPWAVRAKHIQIALRAALETPDTRFVAAEKQVSVVLVGCRTLAEGEARYATLRGALLRRCMTLFEIPAASVHNWGSDAARLKCEVLLREELVDAE